MHHSDGKRDKDANPWVLKSSRNICSPPPGPPQPYMPGCAGSCGWGGGWGGYGGTSVPDFWPTCECVFNWGVWVDKCALSVVLDKVTGPIGKNPAVRSAGPGCGSRACQPACMRLLPLPNWAHGWL